MLLVLAQLCLVLSIILYITATPTVSSPHKLLSSRQYEASVETTFVDTNTVRYDGYEVNNCGDPGVKTSKASRLLGFLSQMKPYLELVIADAQQGTRSKHGYAAFFKSNVNMRKVVSAYLLLVDASPILVDEERAQNTSSRTPQPRLMCINEGDPRTADIMRGCNQGHPMQHPVIIWPGTEVMAICPSFFRIQQYPTTERGCPTLDASGRFRPGDGKLLQGLFAFVVYHLVVMYNREMYTTYHDGDSLWDMQYAVMLNSRQSMFNAASYGYYAGGKFPVLHSFLRVTVR